MLLEASVGISFSRKHTSYADKHKMYYCSKLMTITYPIPCMHARYACAAGVILCDDVIVQRQSVEITPNAVFL